jgi:hypothetical protein
MQVERTAAAQASLLDAARFLAAGVAGGFITGLAIGGVGGRLAMLVLRLTSDPSLHGATTDDGFTIGVVSGETSFLLGTTALIGALGGVLYLIGRGWFPERARPWASAGVFGAAGAAFAIRPDGLDFTLLSPLWLAIAMFIALPVAYGVALSWLVERFLTRNAFGRPGALVAGLLPLALLALLAGIGAFVALGTLAIWGICRAAPWVVEAWRSPPVTWLGRGIVVLGIALGIVGVARDVVEIL